MSDLITKLKELKQEETLALKGWNPAIAMCIDTVESWLRDTFLGGGISHEQKVRFVYKNAYCSCYNSGRYQIVLSKKTISDPKSTEKDAWYDAYGRLAFPSDGVMEWVRAIFPCAQLWQDSDGYDVNDGRNKIGTVSSNPAECWHSVWKILKEDKTIQSVLTKEPKAQCKGSPMGHQVLLGNGVITRLYREQSDAWAEALRFLSHKEAILQKYPDAKVLCHDDTHALWFGGRMLGHARFSEFDAWMSIELERAKDLLLRACPIAQVKQNSDSKFYVRLGVDTTASYATEEIACEKALTAFNGKPIANKVQCIQPGAKYYQDPGTGRYYIFDTLTHPLGAKAQLSGQFKDLEDAWLNAYDRLVGKTDQMRVLELRPQAKDVWVHDNCQIEDRSNVLGAHYQNRDKAWTAALERIVNEQRD